MKLNHILYKSIFRLPVAFALALSLMTVVNAQDLTGVKCVVNGKKAATAESSVEYKI